VNDFCKKEKFKLLVLREKPPTLVRFILGECHFDRISKKLTKINYSDIRRLEGSFIIIERDDGELIFQCIKEVRKNDIVVWERK
jgi:hypothetical protein